MVIDFHTHVFPDKIAERTVRALEINGNAKAHSDGTAAGLLDCLRQAEADIAVNLPVLTSPTQFDSITRFAGELNSREYSDAKIISFSGMHPDCEDVEEKLARLRELGFLGIKIHPDYQQTFIDDPRYVRILECAKALGLIVVTHAGQDGAYVGQPIKCTPRRVLNLLDRIGGYSKLVLAHVGGNEMYDDVYSLLAGEDVYFDTSLCLRDVGEYSFKRLLDKHGDGRILFATDSPWRDISEEIGIVKSYNLGQDTEKKMFSENAKLLLGIQDKQNGDSND